MSSRMRDAARILRGVQARRSARAERENPQRLAAGGVRLSDALVTLDEAEGELKDRLSALADQTRAQLAEAKAKAKTEGSPFAVLVEDRFLPEDPLARGLCRFFDGMHEDRVPERMMAQALTEVLAGAAGHGGVLVPEEVSAKLGGTAQQLLLQVKARAGDADTSTRPRQVREHLGPLTEMQIARSRPRRSYIERMPALAEVSEAFGGPEALAGFTLASVQHLFPSTLGLYDALDENGLDRPVMGVGGKDYSSNADAVSRMMADGYEVPWQAKPRPGSRPEFAQANMQAMCERQLRELFRTVTPDELRADNPKRRFLLLDDGGKLVKVLHEVFPQFAKLCVAVEQTDHGVQVMEEMERKGIPVQCPVVNMARSVAKKESEGPIIGESVAFHTELELERSGVSVEPKVATIIGYGAVGKATADALKRRGYHVVVYDKDPEAMARAAADGCEPLPRDAALAKAQMLVGATGRTVLEPHEYDLLPDHAVLVNAASGNHELGLDALSEDQLNAADPELKLGDDGQYRTRFSGREVLVGDPGEGAPNLNRVVRTRGGKEIMALRAGYVVNMTLGLPPEYCQLTLGLLLAGCLTAAGADTPGLVEIPGEMQRRVVDATRADLAQMGHDLDAPDFRSLAPWPG